MNNEYGHNFYKDRHQKTVYSVNAILAIVVDALPEIHSAVDFGCGVGTWLSVLREMGVIDIQGFDGHWVEASLLEIPNENFRHVDLEGVINVSRRYDLAISLEVAEHLRPEIAKAFVGSLVSAADFILFSAAIPFQGGKSHVNEQWLDYWVRLFDEKGYVGLDFIRRAIWDDENIPVWYRQNAVMFVNRGRINDISNKKLDICSQFFPVSLVHPESYISQISKMSSVNGSFKLFRRAIKSFIKQRLSTAR